MTSSNSSTKAENLMSDQQMAAISEACLSVPQLASALQPFAETPIAHFVRHHFGPPEECGTCGPIIRARLALESAGLAWDDTRQREYNHAESCAECGVVLPDHAPNCGSVSMYDDTCSFRDIDQRQCLRVKGHSGLHDVHGHICDPTPNPPITSASCPACLAVIINTLSTFSPGPWRVAREGDIRYVRASDNRIVATAESMLDGINNAAKESEANANARLIAAAPAMYAALKNSERALKSPGPSTRALPGETTIKERRRQARESVRAALKLAESEVA